MGYVLVHTCNEKNIGPCPFCGKTLAYSMDDEGTPMTMTAEQEASFVADPVDFCVGIYPELLATRAALAAAQDQIAAWDEVIEGLRETLVALRRPSNAFTRQALDDLRAERAAHEQTKRELGEARKAPCVSCESRRLLTFERDALRTERDTLRAERDAVRAEGGEAETVERLLGAVDHLGWCAVCSDYGQAECDEGAHIKQTMDDARAWLSARGAR